MVEPTTAPKLKYDLQPYCERFREGRKAAGLSSAALGQAIGMSPQAISQFERGLQRLDLEKFVAACDAMHLNVRWVLKGLGKMFEGPAPAPKSGRPAKRKKPSPPTPAAAPAS
jgi:transcriptional regulator with XRE-family HTH domain